MKVLHVIQRYPPSVGGSESWCRELCQALAAAGDDVKVLTLDILEEGEFWQEPPTDRCTLRLGRLDRDGQVLVRRYKRSLPVYTLYHSVLKRVFDRWLGIYLYGPHSIEMYGRLRSEVRRADVVHLHTTPFPHNLFGYLAARLCGKPVVITPHFHPGHPHYELRGNYWLLKRCDAVVVISEYEREYLASKGVDPARILTTGIGAKVEDYQPTDVAGFDARLRRVHRLPTSARPILFLGRKLEYKGVAVLVDAFRRLPPHLDAVLLLAGPSSPWFDEFYASLPAADRERIIDLGVVDHADKVHLLHLAEMLALPSQFEAYGMVFLEAWACGTPVVAAATGAVPSIVGDGGLVCEYGNPADLADKLTQLLEDPERARAMARGARQRMLDSYSWEKIAATAAKGYLLARRRGRRLRVLICSNLFHPHTFGGAEIVAHKEALILRDMGVDVEVFCGWFDPDEGHGYRARVEHDDLRKTRVSLSLADISGEWWNFRNATIRQRFAEVLDRFRPDVVHFHNLVGLAVTTVDECAARAIPTVMTLHDYWGICFKNTMVKNDNALCARGGFDCLECKTTLLGESSAPSPVRNSHILLSLANVDRFVSPSRFLADRYAANGIPDDRVTVIRNGIDVERFASVPREHETFTLGFIGHLGRHKGLDVLLRAVCLLPDAGQVRILVAGDGEERQALEALCQELSIDRLVTFRGRIDNQHIEDFYAQIDVLVVPSVWPENSPVTITEAMACGLPVIASDIGGIGELVDHGVTGFLTRPRDPQGFADLIERLRTEPELRAEMGVNALAKIRREGVRDQVGRLLEMFEDLASQRVPAKRPEFDVVLYSSQRYWDQGVRELLNQLARVERRLGRRILICRFDFCDEQTLAMAKVLVLPAGGGDSLRQGLRALQRRIPLLVSASAEEPAELCRQWKSGLVYERDDELGECLELLLTDEPLRQAMGAKGYDMIQAVAEPTSMTS